MDGIEPCSRRDALNRARACVSAVGLCLVLAIIVALSGCASSTTAGPAAMGGPTSARPGMLPGSTGTTRPYGPRPVAGLETYCDSFFYEMTVLSDQYSNLGGADSKAAEDAQSFEFIEQVRKSYQVLTDTAPPDARADLEVINAQVHKANTVAEVIDWRKIPAVAQANTRNQKWVVDKCRFDPSNLANK